jgi:ssDNA-binding Zn-finger/Zn-ribbon topoisomerase 1
MQYPNCGGKLQFAKNTTTLRCENCGVEHLVKQGANGVFLESYAKCPICNRNDKAEKVSSIIRSQVKETESVTYQTKISYK